MIEIKNHRLDSGTVSAGLDVLMDGLKADVSYTDPPWGPALESYFYNQIKEPTFPKSSTLLLDLMQTLKAQTKQGQPIFIEYGRKWNSQVLGTAREAGLHHIVTFQATYAGGLHDVHLFNAEPKFDPKTIHPTTKGKDVARLVIKAHAIPAGILLDPCCGKGFFARVAIENQMRFFGNEPNVDRLAFTEKYIRHHS